MGLLTLLRKLKRSDNEARARAARSPGPPLAAPRRAARAPDPRRRGAIRTTPSASFDATPAPSLARARETPLRAPARAPRPSRSRRRRDGP